MKLLFSSFLFLITGLGANAQTGNVVGKVTDADGKPLASATASLLHASDSSLVKLSVADKNGAYEFLQISSGRYLVAATSVGYKKIYSQPFAVSAENTATAPILVLTTAETGMQGVTVTARRPLVENKIDKMVVNVDASPTNAGATALEVLEKSPGVSVDKDGNISLKGKAGIIVLMDGKQTYLSGPDLANLLRNMPSSQLDQIEIMTQPSAKYDASGNSGIINLRTKKSLQKGFNGSISTSYVQGRTPKTPNSFNFNYRAGKVNLFTSLSYSYWSGYSDQHLLRTFKKGGAVTSVFNQTADQKHHGSNYSARVGLDYSINSKTTIGFLVNGLYNPRVWLNDGRANILNGAGALDSFNIARTENKDKWTNFGGNINFRKVLKGAGRELTADLDAIQYRSKSFQTSDNFNYSPSRELLRDPFLLRGDLPSNIEILSGKIDYTQPLKGGAKLETGVKSSFVSTENFARYTHYNKGETTWVPDRRTNNFTYKEKISAAYVNWSRQAKKWGMQAGLRVENTIADGHQFGSISQKDSTFKTTNTGLFPTAYLSYALNDNNQFGLSYGRRIERPNYRDMNPFQNFLDEYTYQQGNPNLTPQFSNNIELSHNFKKVLNTTLSYTATNNIINDILKQNDESKVTYQTKENVASRNTIGLAVSYNAPVTKWWSTSIYANVNNSHYKGIVNKSPLDVQLTSFMGNTSQQFKFAKTWTGEVSAFYRTRAQETGMFLIEPMGVVSFGLGKQVLKNKGTVKLNITDPFAIQKVKVIIKHENIDAVVHNRWDNRRVGATFTYRFSKGQAAPSQRRKAGGAQEEQNRTGGGNSQ